MTCATQDVEDIHSVLSVMQKNLECPICLDLMKEPVATRCDHIFCRFCMLQLLGKKKKGRAQCPMCKKEVTKRSLQESPRFKLLIDGLMKIINAFELDSGYKFFPSQEYAKNIKVNCKETQEEDEQAVVHSMGYRNRNNKRTTNGGRCEDHPILLNAGTDTQLAREAGTLRCKRPKRQKKDTKQLIAEFVSDSSEDDLFKKAGSLGDGDDEPSLQCQSREAIEPEERVEDNLKSCDGNDQKSLKPESEDVAASDLAEYGFSERDFESTSNVLCMDGFRTLKETSSEKRSAEARDNLILDVDVCERAAEQWLNTNLDGKITHSEHTGSNTPANSNMPPEMHLHNERQTLKIAIDYQYDKDDSVPEEMGSTQDSPSDVAFTVSRKRMKRSIQRVNEWLLKTTELLNSSSWDEELLSEVFPMEDQEASDRGSCKSDETEIMTTVLPCVMPNAMEKSIVNVEDQVFGKVYKRERKSNPVPKVICVADVHVDGVNEPLKVNEVPTVSNLKRKRRSTSGLQPEDFIKRVEANEVKANHADAGPLIVDGGLLDANKNQLKIMHSRTLEFDKITADLPDVDTIPDAEETKPKKQKKSLRRKSDKLQSTRTAQSLLLVRSADAASCKPQTPLPSAELKIDSYPSSNEPGHEIHQQNVRRSRRLKLLPDKPLPYSTGQMAAETNSSAIHVGSKNREPQSVDLPNKTSTLISCEQPCIPVNGSDAQIATFSTVLTLGGNIVADTEIEQSHLDGSARVTDNGHAESWHTPAQAAEMDDSDLDTQYLLKSFKSAKRMSFKLDLISETADKENFDPVNTNLTNGHQGKGISANTDNLGKSDVNEENIQHQSQGQSLLSRQPEHSKKLSLRCKKKCDFPPEPTVKSSSENTDGPSVQETRTMATAGKLNDLNPIKEIEPHEESNQGKNAAVSKSEGLLLHSETESMRKYPVVTHQSPAAVRRGDSRSGTGQGENEQAKSDCYQTHSFDEEQANQITSTNGSQGSMTEKLLGHSASCNSSPDKSPDVYSATPDGLLGSVDRLGEVTRCCVVAEKSFVFGGCRKSTFLDNAVSPVNHTQLLTRHKRRAQKLASSEEESSGDEELPCFNAFLFSNASNPAGQKNASAGSSPKQQGGGVLAMFSSCSTSGKTQASWSLPQEALLCSQESQCSVNLFSSQSNTSDHSVNRTTDHKHTRNQHRTQESSPKRVICIEEEEAIAAENGFPCQEQNLDEVSGCESEASHTGDSSGLSSQCEILNTQQRDAMQNNLEKLQREMAALEAVLEQHGTQSPVSKREQASTAEHVTIRPQEARQKQTNHGAVTSPDTIPETDVHSGQSRLSGLQSVEQPVQFGIRSRSPTPPLSPPQATSRRETPEKVCVSFNVFKELKESVRTQDDANNVKQSAESRPSTQDPDPCAAPSADTLNHAKAPPKRSLRSTPQSHGEVKDSSIPRRGSSRQPAESTELVPPHRKTSKHSGSSQRSSSPTFTSPARSRTALSSVKSPVVSSRRNFSIVASGLSQSELTLEAEPDLSDHFQIMVQKFARKTQSVFSSQMTESTSHVIMKTDEHLVCERTLKYFLGIAGRKWVVSYEWIVQSFREGRILDEYDFEVKGDVINGRNHRGPRRSRLGSDGLLLTDFEICCLGAFKDLTRENLEWMVSLCGASAVNEPSLFKHPAGATSLVIVQPEGQMDYAAMQKKHRALVVTREWVLDSVASYKLQTFDSYRL